MRQIVLDTETTGLDPGQGHRIIELAGLEVVNRRATGRTVHYHLDPEREIDFGATEVHGKTWEDLRGKPKFRDIAPEFLEFACGAEWVIHNAPFDVAFLDVELALAGLPACGGGAYSKLTDTLSLAREMFPGKRNSLDALCERFGVDHRHRTLHGALLDAELLAEVWLAMTRGQESLTIDLGAALPQFGVDLSGVVVAAGGRREPLVVMLPSIEELALHQDYLTGLERETRGHCLWLALTRESDPTAIAAA